MPKTRKHGAQDREHPYSRQNATAPAPDANIHQILQQILQQVQQISHQQHQILNRMDNDTRGRMRRWL
eukprot:tig00020912_g15822.t1